LLGELLLFTRRKISCNVFHLFWEKIHAISYSLFHWSEREISVAVLSLPSRRRRPGVPPRPRLPSSALVQVVLGHGGIPITLSVLFIAAAQRAGFTAVGLSVPKHFIAKAPSLLACFSLSRFARSPSLRLSTTES
jgi:hypothetical protein